MILSRFCRHLPSVIFGLGGSFCFSRIKNFDILGFQKLKQIQKIGSIDMIFKSASDEKDGLTGKALVEYSSKALKLIEMKSRINFSDAIEFIKLIGNNDLKQINRQDFLILLKFINRVEVKLIKYHYSVAQTKLVLSEKLKEILERQNQFKTVEDMEELIQFYLYYADDRFAVLNKVLIPNILSIAHELLRKKQFTVSYRSITNFIIGVSRREILTPYERTIRSIFMVKLKEQAQLIPISELAKLCIELNVMDHFDMDFNDQETISLLFQRLQTLIPNLLELQIKKIFQVSQNPDNVVTLFPVYRQILHFLFDRIHTDGSSDIPSFFIIDIFQHSSRKIKFSKHLDKQQQKKLFAFMNHYINRHNDEKSIGIFNSVLKHMIADKFFNVQDQKIHLEGLLEHIKDKVSIPLLHALQNHGYEVQKLLETNTYDLSGARVEFIVKYSIILRKILNINQNHQIAKAVSPVYAVLSQYFASEDSFSHFMMQIYTMDFTGSLLGQFCDLYPELFDRLKNPFEVNPFNDNYAISYLDFLYKTKHKKSDWVKNFRNTSESKISQDLLLKWLNRQLRYKRQNIEPHRQFIRFFQRNIENFILKKHVKFLKNFLILMAKYIRNLVNNKLQQNIEESVWSIVQILIKNKDIFAELNLNGDLSIFLYPFLCKYRNYHHKHNYKQFVGIIFKNLDYFNNKITFQTDFTRESFRLNLVNKQNCHVITEEIKKRLLPQEYIKYRTLTEHNFVPEIKDKDKIDLDVLVFNPHTQNILEENLAAIENAISSYSLSRLENILVNFNQPITKTSLKIAQMILTAIKLKVSQFETFNTLGVFQAINDHQLCRIRETKDIFLKMMNYYQNCRAKFFSLDGQSIIEIVKYTANYEANSLPLLTQFYELVADWLRGCSNVFKCAVILPLLNTSFNFKAEHLTFLLKMIQMNLKIATRFFLFLQDSYSESSKCQIVSLLAPKIKAAKPQDQIFDWFYTYLKVKYPKEMNDVTLVPSLLPEYRFSFKPAPPILQCLQNISQTLKLDLKLLDSFGNNVVYQFNEKIIVFGKVMSGIQVGFIEKAIKTTKKIDLPVVLLCSKDRSDLLLQQTNLLTKEQILQLTENKHYQQQCKASQEGEKSSKEETALQQ